jgi:hypothetical protein
MLVLVAFVAVSYGCSESDDAERPDGVPPGFIVWTEPIPDALDAPVDGVVTVSQNGCVFVRGSPDSAQEPAIWPFRTTFDGFVILTAEGVEIRDGDSVQGGGGEVEFEFEYYLENTTLAVDLDLMVECGGLDGDRITAFNPTQPIAVVTE